MSFHLYLLFMFGIVFLAKQTRVDAKDDENKYRQIRLRKMSSDELERMEILGDDFVGSVMKKKSHKKSHAIRHLKSTQKSLEDPLATKDSITSSTFASVFGFDDRDVENMLNVKVIPFSNGDFPVKATSIAPSKSQQESPSRKDNDIQEEDDRMRERRSLRHTKHEAPKFLLNLDEDTAPPDVGVTPVLSAEDNNEGKLEISDSFLRQLSAQQLKKLKGNHQQYLGGNIRAPVDFGEALRVTVAPFGSEK